MKTQNRFDIRLFWGRKTEDVEGGDDTGGAGDASTAEQSQSASLDMGSDGKSDKSSVDWNSVVPKDLREKPYFKQILESSDPGKELVTQFDNAQKLIGSRTNAIPKDDAPDKEWEEFYKSTRPEKVDDYELKDPEIGDDQPEFKAWMSENTTSDEDKKTVREIMHKYGLSKKQSGVVNELQNWFTGKVSGLIQGQVDAEKELNTHFDKMVNTNFSGDKDKAVQAGRNFIDKLATEKTKKYAQGLPNEALMIIADMGVQFAKKYDSEDSVMTSDANSGRSTSDSLRQGMRDLMASDAYQNVMHADHDATVTKVRAMSGQIADAQRREAKSKK
jgi:hypothetical protein